MFYVGTFKLYTLGGKAKKVGSPQLFLGHLRGILLPRISIFLHLLKYGIRGIVGMNLECTRFEGVIAMECSSDSFTMMFLPGLRLNRSYYSVATNCGG